MTTMTSRAKAPARKPPLPSGSEWTAEAIERYNAEIARVAAAYRLDLYPVQIEIITAEQMMDAYASVGMPVNYHHWSFGKHFLSTEKGYKRGQMGLAYEIVINSNPCIAYLMEENTLTMQGLVIAHAAYGHNSFFKGNYLFRTWTNADAIIDYLVFARNYISECEQRHGEEEVELLLDSCHALMNLGVDRYKRPPKLSLAKEKLRQQEREEYLQGQVNDLWRTLPAHDTRSGPREAPRFPPEPEENLLYFIEKNAPLLEPWQREVVRIVRKIAQYFFPQRQTQVMNEGWATFWHYTLLNHLYDEGLLADSFMLEFLQSHTNVVYQPPYNSRWFNGINPYALGFAMWQDIRRMCEHPDDEDRRWFPEIAGSDWLDTFDFAMRNFKDESFIAQYLSPKVMRDFRMFAVLDDDRQDKLEVSAIHDDSGFRRVREILSDQYNLGAREPNVQAWNVDLRGDRSLTLRHQPHRRRPLGGSTDEVMRHLARLWGFTVRLESVDEDGNIELKHEIRAERRRNGN
ncbi:MULTISPECIES: SpoVR family protein [unclassified Thauera]|uniref:SpoVR family protein n=1 Tax=unclassified Thauera TaxID=2609274 RepID=UPI0002D093FF|nr:MULTISPECIES: SpoVR family protein [unclassified Thauera]ENO83281.1 SpoVR family protein [Thauera sp. 27]ENO93192.1 SpoVR family protein [Thauera sp. 28]WBL62719.1 SpoVR family protein [Thauera sp. WB-2]HAG75008.1 SpoVR family protein [Thauera sp.]HNS92410.1 SpoVR family protein [Thauera sp.]